MAEIRDEVSYTDYTRACKTLKRCADFLEKCDPDEAAEHWLPEMTKATALIFSFVGSNMTARHVAGYTETLMEHERAKSGDVGTLTKPQPQEGE